jgi:hypothetical protein
MSHTETITVIVQCICTSKEFSHFLMENTKQKVSLHVKWFHWIISEFTGHSEQDLLRCSKFIGLMNEDKD